MITLLSQVFCVRFVTVQNKKHIFYLHLASHSERNAASTEQIYLRPSRERDVAQR